MPQQDDKEGWINVNIVGYSAMPQQDDKEGLVGLMFKKKQAELEAGMTWSIFLNVFFKQKKIKEESKTFV